MPNIALLLFIKNIKLIIYIRVIIIYLKFKKYLNLFIRHLYIYKTDILTSKNIKYINFLLKYILKNNVTVNYIIPLHNIDR